MKNIFYVLMCVVILCSGKTFAGGGGCDGLCPPNPEQMPMLICEVTALKQVGDFGSGSDNSFDVAQVIVSKFAVGNKFVLLGSDQQIKIVRPEVTANKLHLKLDFEFIPSSSGSKRFHHLINWGSDADDYPLLKRTFIEFYGQDSYGYGHFSVSFERSEDISGVKNKLIQTYSGNLKCEIYNQ